MINHVMIGVNDIEKSRAFYDAVFGAVGCDKPMRNEAATGHVRYFYNKDGHTFAITQPINDADATCANGFTLGIKCSSPAQLQELHDIALANGGSAVEDGPGPRETSMGTLYLCYFLDPDGHKICGIHRPA